MTTTIATIKSVDTPFVRASEPRLTAQQVAARTMQAHDEAHKAVSCMSSDDTIDIDVAYGDVDVGRRIEEAATPSETGFWALSLSKSDKTKYQNCFRNFRPLLLRLR